MAYLDDVLCWKSQRSLDELKSTFREVGLVVAEHKCEIYNPYHSVCQSIHSSSDIPISSDGVIILGTPIVSASFVGDASSKIAREGENLCGKLTTFNDLQSAVLLFRHCHLSRLHHLALVIHPDTLHQAATIHENQTEQTLCCPAQLSLKINGNKRHGLLDMVA